MSNSRVDYLFGDVAAGQLAASQASRTNFTPGTTTGRAGDMNWPTDFRIPTGNPAFEGGVAGPVEMERSRVVLTGRNIVCDQVLVSVPDDPTNTTQENDGRKERNSGYDRIAE